LAVALMAWLAGLSTMLPTSASAATPDASSSTPVSALSPAEVETLLGGVPLRDLSTTQLVEALSELPGLSSLPAGPREQALAKAIEALAAKEGTLGQLEGGEELVSVVEGDLKEVLAPSELLSLLKGETLSGVLSEALGSVSGREVLGKLLSSAEDPEQLIEEVLASANPQQLEAALHSVLAGEPFTKGTLAELASRIGSNEEGLATDFGTIDSQLPPEAMALTTPLADGKTLGVLDTLEGVDVGTLGSGHEGSGGTGGSSNGGSGGPGGTGSTGAPGSTTIMLAEQAPLPAAASSEPALAKVKILSRKVKGDAVTLTVQVPAAGKLTVAGDNVKSVSQQADAAQRLTVRATLTKAIAASLHKRRRSLKVKLKASFKAVGGASSSATTSVAFA
jgi:hypothetical protein